MQDSKSHRFQAGQRVLLTSGGDMGYVLGVRQSDAGFIYRVGFPGGDLEVREAFLELAPHSNVNLFDQLTQSEQTYPRDHWVKHEALRLQNAYRNDPVSALSNSRVEPQPHQISVLVRVTEKAQARMVLADEVGLGKTIEAGLILKELRARGALERVLILAPASLVSQWAWELRSKFNEQFQVHDGAYVRSLRNSRPDANPWTIHPDVLCSIHLARLDQHREDIAKADWDLVIVDEAHHVRRHWDEGNPRSNNAYDLVDELHDRVSGLLLLTATPMQLHPFELFSMVRLVEPGLFESFSDFENHRQQIRRINQMVSWLQSGAIGDAHRAELARLLRELKAPQELLNSRLERPGDRDALAGWIARQHRLSEAMVRNRKAEVGGFVVRQARRITVQPNPGELELEAMVSSYVVDEHRSAQGSRGRVSGFVLVVFQKLLCSSSYALASALDNRARRLEQQSAGAELHSDDPDLAEELSGAIAAESRGPAGEARRLRQIAEFARSVRDAKLDALERALLDLFRSDPNGKALIFTQFITTLEMIRSRLSGSLRVSVFHGQLTAEQKDASVQEFKGRGQILISTEAGGEGRNFQFCHRVFNYDLPWNPMKIEQRIGRVDRIGQTMNVFVYNFAVAGTLDERILTVLDERIRVFTESVGALDPILGDVEGELEQLCLQDLEAAKRSIERYEVALETRLERARRQEQQERDLIMDMRSFRRADVETLLGRRASAGAEDLEQLVVEALGRYPSASAIVVRPGVWRLVIAPALRRRDPMLRDSYDGTFMYQVALQDERLEFFAFGHPLVDRLVADASERAFATGAGVASINNDDGLLTVDFEVELAGVRDTRELHSQVVGSTGARGEANIRWERVSNDIVERPAWPSEVVANMAEASRRELDEFTSTRFSAFQAENTIRYEEELRRQQRIFAARQHSLEERVERNVRLIAEAEAVGEGSSRSVAARRGVVTRARRALAEIAFEHESALAGLAQRREATMSVKPLLIAALRDPGDGRAQD